MTTFTVTVNDQGVQAVLAKLSARMSNLAPVLQVIGDDIAERAKRRFETSSGPDGHPWLPNSAATLNAWAGRLGKSHRKKNGELNAKGKNALGGKKPLIGESGDLRRQIGANAGASSVTIFSTPAYAAIQQFGGQAGRGHKVTIPARPFLPVRLDGTLYRNCPPSTHIEIQDSVW
ncbi:phage virion morphogenesis protein [Polaromonas sp.]|uniref:phage virion morphogenesis protein n=1 Tax=Polaromonas sp. TaxID=1869339 RepID=UPI003BB69A45